MKSFSRNMVVFCDSKDPIDEYILEDSRDLVAIDFKDVNDFESCIQKLGCAFKCPVGSSKEIHSRNFLFYLPYFKGDINLVIENFNHFSNSNPQGACKMVDMFRNSVLPFWDNPSKLLWDEEESPKNFDVYIHGSEVIN